MLRLIIVLLLLAAPLRAQTPNQLLGEDSPYLLQHAYNEVYWYPWGPEALNKARAEGKPIFLSVGYSSCLWCHVMREESFEDAEIGAFLNEYFISIKIDRERRPDLDEQFMLATQTVAGVGGWPNTVFLTSEAKPFFGGTYFPPEQLLDILKEIQTRWRNDRTAVLTEADDLSVIVGAYLSSSVAARELTAELATDIAYTMLTRFDYFNGGMGVAPKFPRETAYLFLLDQAERDQNPDFLEAVTLTLDGIIMGGIHDQVAGGFHRYSIDPEWRVPHFEKMLYNQALIGRLLTRAARITGRADYERAALRAFDYVLRDMQSPSGGFYSAEDAASLNPDGESEEGVYNTWTQDQIRAAAGDEAEFLIDVLNVSQYGNFENTNSVYMDELPNDPEFYARFDAALALLDAARKTRSAPFKDEKIIVAWNGAMIETLAEASDVFDRPDYYQAAENAAGFIYDTMFIDGNLMRISYQGSPSVEGQLVDYASLGLGFIALHDYAPDIQTADLWLARAVKMNTALKEKFLMQDGTFAMTENIEGLGAFRPVDDSELPGGNGMVLALLNRLANRVEDPAFSLEATDLAAAISGLVLAAPEQRAYSVNAIRKMTYGNNEAVRFVANGVVRINADIDRASNTISLNLRIKEGWHINAHVPLEDFFIPTDLLVDGTSIGSAAFPEPLVTTLAFNMDQPLALYEQEINLTADIPPPSGLVTSVVLVLQACSDEICLAPQEVRFNIW
ncbi:MAG: DUF255 domain-containing protein [Rhodobacteraceae bacterium]|nr:DUF255 domain-containing protein [Paracoccaceae bacterium]